MNDELLKLDTSKLPRPRELSFRIDGSRPGHMRLLVDLPSIQAAREWAAALEITLKDTDPNCRYIMVRQESGTAVRGQLRVQVIGTESTPIVDWDARRVVQAAARITAAAVAS